ncbi:MAG: hypothetical protein MUF72_10095 [Elainella sp. Prado103]|jgi:hypothetical protein|nr:hypothetical protein [Elainella sp. Prado103]
MAGTRVSVKASARSNFSYGFITQVDSDERTQLGHTPIVGALAAGVMFGVNSPKPARAFKVRATGRTVSSFVDAGSRTSALAAGWRISKRAKARGKGSGAFSKPVYVLFETGSGVGAVNIKYAWNMPLDTYTAIGTARTGLGIRDIATTDDNFDLVFGGYPKPTKAYKRNADGTTISTFAGSDAELPAGWALVGGEEE